MNFKNLKCVRYDGNSINLSPQNAYVTKRFYVEHYDAYKQYHDSLDRLIFGKRIA